MSLAGLASPALVLDRGRVIANARSMRRRAAELGVALRPHLKTAKSAAVAEIALADGLRDPGAAATVSTLREAEYFAQHGLTDLVLAVCVASDKLDRAAALVERGAQLTLLTDDRQTALAIAAHPVALPTLVEIDSGGARTGLTPDDPDLVGVAEALGDCLRGVLTHAGHSYGAAGAEALAAIAEEERRAGVAAADRLRTAGLRCDVVSLGSTPTAVHLASASGATEMRPGVYLFMDLFQWAIGCCELDDIALSVLATVISRRGDRVVLDAGGLALSKDRSTAHSPVDQGYGRVCDLAGEPLFDSVGGPLLVADVHQEHGLVPRAPAGLGPGDRVRVLPNHACMTAAAYEGYHVVDGGLEVIDRYGRCNGW